MQSSLFQIYETLILRHPRSALFIILLFSLSMALGLPKFKLDASADSLTLENDDDLNFSREVVKRYGSDNFFIVTFAPINGDLFSQDNLNTLTELRDGLAEIEGIESVLSMLDVPLLYSPKVDISDLTGELNTLMSGSVDKAQAKQEFLTSPLYSNVLLSADGQTTGMMATLELDETYLSMVAERDGLRLLRDTEGLDREQSDQEPQ